MAINSLELNKVLVPELDKAVVEKSATGFLADNVLRAKFVGAKTVMIPEMDMSGLGDYDRDTGFIRGTLSVTNTPFTLTMDRGRSLSLDAQDNDETGVSELAGQVLGELVRTKVVPELDAYVLSKLAGYAGSKGHTMATTSGQEYANLATAINAVQNEIGYSEELVVFASATFWGRLNTSSEFTRTLDVTDFKKGELNTKVKSVNGVPIIPVSDGLMKSSYVFYDGVDHSGESGGVDQSVGGFVPADSAGSTAFLVLPKRAASLVKKTEKLRVFSPDVNQQMDAYKFDYRLYYDVFVKNSLGGGIYVCSL